MIAMGTDEGIFQSLLSPYIGFDRIALHCQVISSKLAVGRNLTSLKNWSSLSSGSIRAGMVKSAFRIPKDCSEKERATWFRGNYLTPFENFKFLAVRHAHWTPQMVRDDLGFQKGRGKKLLN